MSLQEYHRLKKYYQSLGLEVVKGTKLQYLQELEPIIGAFVEASLTELLPGKTLQEIHEVYNEVVGETGQQCVDTETVVVDDNFNTTRPITSHVLQSPVAWENSSPSTRRLGIYYTETTVVEKLKDKIYYCDYPRVFPDGLRFYYVEIEKPVTKTIAKTALSNRSFSGSPELGILAPPEYHANYERDYTVPYSFERLDYVDLGRVTNVGTPGYSKLNKRDRQTKSTVVTPTSKKTKSKINWGTKSVGTYGGTSKSSTTAIKQAVPLAISTQSRWFTNPLNQRYCWRIKDSLIYQVYENGSSGYEFKATYIDEQCVDWIPVPTNFTWNNSSYHDSIKQQLKDLFPHEQYRGKETIYKESISARERENLIKPIVSGEDEITLPKIERIVRRIPKPVSPKSQYQQQQVNARKEKVLANKYPQKQGAK